MGATILRTLTPTRGKGLLRSYDWTYFLVFLFSLKEKARDAEAELKSWIHQQEADWCDDDDDDQGRPSYIVMGTRDNRIQGPAFYVLLAGVTDNVQISVNEWNDTGGMRCTCFRFRAFGENAHPRREALIGFLSGLFDLNCLACYRVNEKHRIPQEKSSSR